MKFFFTILFLSLSLFCNAQERDSLTFVGEKAITLSEVVVNNRLDVPDFIYRIEKDSSFYKAFRNLHIIGYTAFNDIRMLKKNGNIDAALYSKTKQIRKDGCRTMETLEEKITGKIYDENGEFLDYTPKMYASLFFTKGKVCGEDNIVGDREFSTSDLSGLEKHKEQLRMLFFNPGRKIDGIPFMGNKTAIYSDDMADRYDMNIDYKTYAGTECYVFTQTVKPGKRGKVVVDEMKTWFDAVNMKVVARTYSLAYNAAVYDFKVDMEVQMTTVGDLTVPKVIRYNGNWKAVTKKRERAVFTATLFDFVL